MSLAIGRIKLYVRLTLIVAVALAVGAVLWKNRGHQVQVWFFWWVEETTPINVLWLMLCTALGTLGSFGVLRMVWTLRRDLKKAARESALAQREKAQAERTRELADQERRIDAKLRQGLTQEAEK